jgi:hypothetical protein
MSTKKLKTEKYALETFKKKVVLEIEHITELLKCSIPTARRRLKKWEVYTSYNKNGRYYVLPEIPDFNNYNLWYYNNIFFSKYGTLKNTVICLIRSSDTGMTSNEIENIVNIPAKSFLSHLQKTPELFRKKIEGRFVYFSSNKKVLKKQKQNRISHLEKSKIQKLPNDIEAIEILINIIKYPDLKLEELSKLLRKKNIMVPPYAIYLFFEKHGILKKKRKIFGI